MSEAAGVAPVRKAVRQFLEQGYGSTRTDQDRDFVVHRGGNLTWVRVQGIDDEHTAIVVFSPAAIGVSVDGELTRFLATEGLELDLAHFELHERRTPMAVVSHTLLGEYLSREELTTAVDEVSSAALRYGPQISERFGGSVPWQLTKTGRGKQIADTVGSMSGSGTARTSRGHRVWAALQGVAALVGLGAALFAHSVSSSWWLAGFVFVMALLVVGRAVPAVITGPDKVRRAVYVGLIPVLCVAILALTYWLSGRWWLAVVLGLVGGVLGGAAAGVVFFEDMVQDELQRDKERSRSGYLAGGLT